MSAPKKVPYSDLTSYYVDRPDRRALDLREAGLPECVVLGHSFYRRAYPQLVEHRHFGVAELAFVATGYQPYNVGGQRFALLGGEGAVIPPETPHSSDGHPSYPGKRFWLQLRLPSSAGARWLGLSPAEAKPLLDMLRAPGAVYAKWPADFARRAEYAGEGPFNLWRQGTLPWVKATSMRECRRRLRASALPKATQDALLWSCRKEANAAMRAAQFRGAERLFALWHVLHLPLVVILVITALVHVLAVHMY